MTTRRSKKSGRRGEDQQFFSTDSQDTECEVIDVERSGEWMPAEELREAGLTALLASKDMTLNLDRIDHLDASALQVLLAIEVEQENLGQHLHLVNASPRLLERFELSGAAGHFFGERRTSDE